MLWRLPIDLKKKKNVDKFVLIGIENMNRVNYNHKFIYIFYIRCPGSNNEHFILLNISFFIFF